ncbi:hypothetical protein JXQ31_12025 [candidate division KSB1 bacterium]|nr:hypothetical protein [candidate division KSB1 bacterium]
MKKLIFCLLFFTLLIINCERDKTILDPARSGNYTIKYGTSFNMCSGYCKFELYINETYVAFIASSWEPRQYPEKSITGQLNTAELERLQSLIDFNEITKYEEFIGCPDCADGGAEWIQVKQDKQTKKITFEYGDTLNSINELIELLRDIFETYDKKMFPSHYSS